MTPAETEYARSVSNHIVHLPFESLPGGSRGAEIQRCSQRSEYGPSDTCIRSEGLVKHAFLQKTSLSTGKRKRKKKTRRNHVGGNENKLKQ